MTRNEEWFWRASAELGLRAELGFVLPLSDGTSLYPFARIYDLGAPLGMLLFSSTSEIRGEAQTLIKLGYGYSVLSEPRADEEFDIESFREVFRDWGWSGARDQAPAWIQGVADETAEEWRELGFFPEIDSGKSLCRLTGSRAGLLRFRDILLDYVADPRNAVNGEHEHYGPYGSLEIMTWPEAGFDDHAIQGSLVDLTRLAKLVESKLATVKPNSLIHIREEFANDSVYTLLLDVRDDQFDPASADPDLSSDAT